MTYNELDSCVPELDLSSGDIGIAFRERFPDMHPSTTLMSAADMLLSVFNQSFKITDYPGPYGETLAFFDPIRGVWVTDDTTLQKLFDAVKPGIGKIDFVMLKHYLAHIYWHRGETLRESILDRYVAFENGVLDMATLDLWPLDSFKVRSLCLTPRHEVAATWTSGAEDFLPDFAKQW